MRHRNLLIAFACLGAVVILMCFAPVRRAVSDFLGVFRVRKFALVQMNPADAEGPAAAGSDRQLTSLAGTLLTREVGITRVVTDAEDATAEAGFHVRTPGFLPAEALREEFTLEKDAKVQVELGKVLAESGVDVGQILGASAPITALLTQEVVIPYTVRQVFRVGEREFTLFQVSPPPVGSLPMPDPSQLSTILLGFLGVSGEDAERLSRALDWTSIIVVPIPEEVTRLQEVEVDGVTGVLLEGAREEGSRRRPWLVLWQKAEVVLALTGYGTGPVELLRMADSLE